MGAKRLIFLLFFVLCFANEAFSTHLVGGYAGYEYLGKVGNTSKYRYRIYFNVYRDCNSKVDFDPTIEVCVYSGNGKFFDRYVLENGRPKRVDPIGNTSCPENTKTCIEVSVYEMVVELPQSNFGYILKWERCCRNTQNNLPNGFVDGVFQPTQGQTYLCKIPPTSIPNKSAYFTEVPVPYICLNDTTQIRSYAVDPDGDSLVFRFAKPWSGGGPNDAIPGCESFFLNAKPITYNSGFDESKPFGSDGYSDINPSTGTMSVMARSLGAYALAIDVEEYRNGILINTVRLDIQLLVINCTPNNKPKLNNSSSIFVREVNAGDKICFDITAQDIDNQNVKLSAYGEMFMGGGAWVGPTASFPTKKEKTTVTSTFCWQTSCEQARPAPYTFVIEAIDDGCPPKFINETYYIYVKPFKSKLLVTGVNPVCPNVKGVRYQALNVAAGNSVYWEVDNGLIVSGQGTNEIMVDWDFSKPSGVVRAKEISKSGCEDNAKSYNVTFDAIPPSPEIFSYSSISPLIPADTICVGNPIYFKPSAATLNNALDWTWYDPDGNIIHSLNQLEFTPTDTGHFSVNFHYVTKNNCPSDTVLKTIVAVKSLVDSIFGPKTACPNNGGLEFYVKGFPGSTYQWIADGAIIQKGQGTDTVTLAFGDPTTIMLKVIETTAQGCVGDTLYHAIKVTYDLIIEEPLGDYSVCEYSKREKYIPYPFVHNTIYYWSVTGGVIDEIDSNYFFLYVNWGAAGMGKLAYYQTAFDTLNSKQCLSNTVVKDVVINPIPKADIIEGVFEVCQYTSPMTFTLNGFENSRYHWEINGDTLLDGQGSKTIKFPTDNAGKFNIKVFEISEHGCLGSIIDSVFEIHPKPVTTPILGEEILCFPDFLNKKYSVTGFSTSTYHWKVDGGKRKDTLYIPNVTVDWSGKQYNYISVYERSDFGCIGDTLTKEVFIDSIGIDIKVVTVSPPPAGDKQVIINWELINAPRYNSTFRILKKVVNPEEAFKQITEVPGNVFSFTEDKVNTRISPFDYIIKGTNLCGTEISSPIHRTILLKGEKFEEYSAQIDFTEYQGWHQGVLDYVVYRKLLNKSPFEEYDWKNSPVRIQYENGIDHYTQCYRIKANENSGRGEESWSNEVCFDYPPLMYIPNAFSPDGNGLNDGFGPTAATIKSFKMTVFNRWGEKLFVTDDYMQTWDGTYLGAPCKQDVYVFFIEYTDYADRYYSTKGTFTLLR
ncbi:MAG: gliding motility-associated C-terminal domain-containing protein [Bacteroidetes bacterium]|nr:gliding motility-associated C-terminal domain-containing protein [Bacteroidota bacterium]